MLEQSELVTFKSYRVVAGRTTATYGMFLQLGISASSLACSESNLELLYTNSKLQSLLSIRPRTGR